MVRSQDILACRCGWEWRPAQSSEPHHWRSAPIAMSGLPRPSFRCSPGCLLHRRGLRVVSRPAARISAAPCFQAQHGARRFGVFASIGYGIIAAFLVPRFAALDFAGQNFALTVFGIAFIITRFLGSGYAARFGGRRVLLSAFLIESVGLAGLFLTDVEWLAFTSTAVAGAGLSLLIPSVTSLVTEAADPRERTAAVGAVTSACDLGVLSAAHWEGLLLAPRTPGRSR